ncbi:MAG: MATE family efflux transporter [Planctomycetota bacterium]
MTTLADRGIVPSILCFGLPLVLGMSFHALINLVDLWIVGKLGTQALAAVTIATMVNTVPMVIMNGISTSSIAFMARSIGFRNMDQANRVMGQSLILTVILSVVLGVLPWFYARELVIALQGKGEVVVETATEYLAIVSLGTVTMFLLMQITAVLRAAGDGLWPFVLLVGANFLNLVLDWALVFGHWGFPNLGAPGAAWATVISRAIFVVIGFVILVRGRNGLRLRLTWLRVRVQLLVRLLRVGLPASGQWVVRLVAMLAILWIVGDYDPVLRPQFDESAQAAFGIGLRLDLLTIFAAFGWGAAASTMVGQHLGGRRPDRAEKSAWITTWICVLMMVAIGAAYYLSADELIRFFGHDREIVDVAGTGSFERVTATGAGYLRIVVFSYAFVAIAMVLSQSLNGAGSTKTPLLIDCVGLLLVQLPLAYSLSRRPELGLEGIWYAIVASNAFMALLYLVWFKVGRWKKKELW